MRLAGTIFMVLLIFFAPAWLYLPAILLGILFFPFFVEAIIMAFLIDLLYGPARHGQAFFGFPLAVLASLLVLLAILFRERLRSHA
jgi:hypothetical protein